MSAFIRRRRRRIGAACVRANKRRCTISPAARFRSNPAAADHPKDLVHDAVDGAPEPPLHAASPVLDGVPARVPHPFHAVHLVPDVVDCSGEGHGCVFTVV